MWEVMGCALGLLSYSPRKVRGLVSDVVLLCSQLHWVTPEPPALVRKCNTRAVLVRFHMFSGVLSFIPCRVCTRILLQVCTHAHNYFILFLHFISVCINCSVHVLCVCFFVKVFFVDCSDYVWWHVSLNACMYVYEYEAVFTCSVNQNLYRLLRT